MEIQNEIRDIFIHNYNGFSKNGSLQEINSIKLIEILVMIEERFDIEFNDVEYISNFKTMDDICKRVMQLMKKEI
jgi:acyl carrier protein